MRSMRGAGAGVQRLPLGRPHAARRGAHAPPPAACCRARARRRRDAGAGLVACRGRRRSSRTGRCSSTSTARCSRSPPTPDAVHPGRADSELLGATRTRRPAARWRWSAAARSRSIDQLFAPLRLPAAGQHGVERRDARGLRPSHRFPADACCARRAVRHPQLRRAARRAWCSRTRAQRGAALPPRAAACERRARRGARGRARRSATAVEVQAGKMVVELKPAGRDKGKAIDAVHAGGAVRRARAGVHRRRCSPTNTASAW